MLDHRQPLVQRGELSTRPYSSPNLSLAQNPKPQPQITNPKCCLGVSTKLEPCKQGIKPFDFFSYHHTVANLPCHRKVVVDINGLNQNTLSNSFKPGLATSHQNSPQNSRDELVWDRRIILSLEGLLQEQCAVSEVQ